MHLSVIFAVGGLLLAGRFLFVAIYRNFFSPLASVPGPYLARFTDLWYLWRVYRGSFEQDNIALHHNNGPVVRYGPNRYSLSDPQAGKIIYGHGTSFPKSSWYTSWEGSDPSAWTLFADRDAKRHAINRRLYQNIYSMSTLVQYESYVDECADVFRLRLQELSSSSAAKYGVIDMGHWFQCYAFDVIGMITYSKRLGFLDQGKDIGEVIKNLENHLAYASLVGIYAFLHKYLAPIRSRLNGKRGTGRAYVMEFTKDRFAEHQAKPVAVSLDEDDAENGVVTSQDFLSKFLAKHTSDPSTFTQYHVLSGCVSNMVAGSDTTAISLSAILYYLLRYPETMERLRREVDAAYHEKGDSVGNVTFQESQQMPYLQAVMKEALRMHPATGLPLERVVPDEGAVICDRVFPKGTVVGINSWVEHYDTSIFGADADQFKPERWLAEDSERVATMNRHWMPFGLGSRTCIGRHISTLEMSKLIPRLVREFDFELLDKASWKTNNYWFVKPVGFNVRIRPRQYASAA